QQQRVALIKPLLVRPDVMIFDESMSALDYYHQHIIIDLIIRMQEETGFAGIFISHDMRLLQRIAHRALELKGGTFVQEVVF
ncbi:MAG TPA: ABC transporter ATP-binding protein, partial [Saprospiraceae bacterium]|nr:ABC transporter ATP-binding protein [Saprospiraceae bacterium]